MNHAYMLLEGYLALLNQVLTTGAGGDWGNDDFWMTTRHILDGRRIGVAVYLHSPREPEQYFTVQFSDGGFHILAHGLAAAGAVVRLSRGYLEEVVANPDRVSPSRLERDWEPALDRS